MNTRTGGIFYWAIPIIIRTPPVEEPWNFQGRECVNPGMSREGGIPALDFQGEE
jgi:hypothetical protein